MSESWKDFEEGSVLQNDVCNEYREKPVGSQKDITASSLKE